MFYSLFLMAELFIGGEQTYPVIVHGEDFINYSDAKIDGSCDAVAQAGRQWLEEKLYDFSDTSWNCTGVKKVKDAKNTQNIGGMFLCIKGSYKALVFTFNENDRCKDFVAGKIDWNELTVERD